MMNQQSHSEKPSRPLRYWMRKIHIWVSMTAAVPLILFSITGMVLNHKKTLERGFALPTGRDTAMNPDSKPTKQPVWIKLCKELHNGKALGGVGVAVLDISAVLLIVSAGSGVVLFFPAKGRKAKMPLKKRRYV